MFFSLLHVLLVDFSTEMESFVTTISALWFQVLLILETKFQLVAGFYISISAC
jgi:hypothetical protein